MTCNKMEDLGNWTINRKKTQEYDLCCEGQLTEFDIFFIKMR